MGQSRARPFAFAALAFFMPLCLVAGSGQPPWVQLGCTGAAGAVGCALLVWLWRQPAFDTMAPPAVFALALLLRLAALAGSPLLEDDYFRYLWDGYQFATTGSPYGVAPAARFGDPSVPAAWQQVLSGINYPDIPTIYGPVLELLFAAAYAVAPGQLGAIKAILLVVDMTTLLVLARAGVSPRWLLAFAVHPLVLKEAVASAHPDGLVGLLLLLALLAWRAQRPWQLGALLALAVATKVAALVALPLLLIAPCYARQYAFAGAARAGLWPWGWRVLAALSLTLCLLYAPFIWQGADELVALHKFGTQWRFNPLVYRLLEAALPGPLARPLAGFLVLAVVIALALVWRGPRAWGAVLGLKEAGTMPPVAGALVALLLLAPVVNPWYWLWALAPAVLLGHAAVLAAAAVAWVSYGISHHTWGASQVPPSLGWVLAALQCAVVFGVAWVQGHRVPFDSKIQNNEIQG